MKRTGFLGAVGGVLTALWWGGPLPKLRARVKAQVVHFKWRDQQRFADAGMPVELPRVIESRYLSNPLAWYINVGAPTRVSWDDD